VLVLGARLAVLAGVGVDGGSVWSRARVVGLGLTGDVRGVFPRWARRRLASAGGE